MSQSSRSEQRRRKRPAPKVGQTLVEDVYIARNSPFEAQLARAISLLESDDLELIPFSIHNHILQRSLGRVTLHGLGAAINRCINIALQLQAKFSDQVETSHYISTYLPLKLVAQMRVETDTVSLLDEVESDNLDALPVVSKRNNSAIHVYFLRRTRTVVP
eukprot:gene4088-8461_t